MDNDTKPGDICYVNGKAYLACVQESDMMPCNGCVGMNHETNQPKPLCMELDACTSDADYRVSTNIWKEVE